MQVYLVGGAVRDGLLGLPVRERDWVVVGATPEEMERAGYRSVGKEFPVFLHPQTQEEYALARLERKVAPGYRGFKVEFSPAVTLEEDLRRRDLTVNAMARDAAGKLVDPYGGERDLAARSLRHVSEAFVEDPVRILRVARFAARFAPLGFSVAPETLALMAQMVHNGEASALVSERVWRELALALEAPQPQRAFEVLRDCAALAVLLPELAAPERLAPALAALGAALASAADTAVGPVRFAALLARIPTAEIEALCGRLRVPVEYRELALLAARLAPEVAKLAAAPAGAGAGVLLGLLDSTDAFRRVDRYTQWVRVMCALARLDAANGGDAAQGERQAQRLATLLPEARTRAAGVLLSAAEVLDLRGPQIGARLREKRLAALAAMPALEPAARH
jgi:tRNA nucleotidyltransferase (CCA-adding enzyme)